MKTSYDERDYAYGTTMQTLRTTIGLTQDGLAKYLGISRRAVEEWEVGSSYPKAQHLKALIALGVKQQAWTPGSEAREIRALWKTARQKALLDEHWLSTLLEQERSPYLHIVPKPAEAVGTCRDSDLPLSAPTHHALPPGPRTGKCLSNSQITSP